MLSFRFRGHPANRQKVFPLQPEDFGKQLDLGQIKLLVAAAHEPAGKPLEQCQKVTVLLTLDAKEDLSGATGQTGGEECQICPILEEELHRLPEQSCAISASWL